MLHERLGVCRKPVRHIDVRVCEMTDSGDALRRWKTTDTSIRERNVHLKLD